MKIIFDFDDVLFKASDFKQVIFDTLKRFGINDGNLLYEGERKTGIPFTLKRFLYRVFEQNPEVQVDTDAVYEEIMNTCKDLSNQEIIQTITKIGKDNCYIVSNGDSEYQYDKITRVGLDKLVAKIIIVPGTKNMEIQRICNEFPHEEVIFVDDKSIYFDDINREACPNLTTVTYDEHGQANLEAKISAGLLAEQKKYSPSIPMR